MGITRQQALDCFASDDLIGIGMEADAVRRKLHPEGVVSYVLDRKIDLTDSFQTSADLSSSIVELFGFERIYEQISDVLHNGGTGVSVHGDRCSALNVDSLVLLFRAIKQRFPNVSLHGLNASAVLAMAGQAQPSVRDTLLRLHEAGLDSLAGDDAEILDDAVRQRFFPESCCTEDWLSVHRMAHQLGMQSTASMCFGAGETMEQRLKHLEILHGLQQETAGFTAFLPQTYQPHRAGFAAQGFEEATSVEFLKTVAVSRMMLESIENVQSSWTMQGLKVLQMGLRFGSNDVGSALTASAGSALHASNRTIEEELRRVIRDAGFKPVQRDALYRTMFLN